MPAYDPRGTSKIPPHAVKVKLEVNYLGRVELERTRQGRAGYSQRQGGRAPQKNHWKAAIAVGTVSR